MKNRPAVNTNRKSPAKYVAGLLVLAIITLTAIKPEVLYPPFWAKDQCYKCFKPATHTTTYIVVGQGKEYDLRFCEEHEGPPRITSNEGVPGRGFKVFLMIAMVVLSFSFLWGCYRIFFRMKPSPLSFWIFSFPLFLLLLGIGFYLLGLETAGRIISWTTLSLLVFVWMVILFDTAK